MASFIFLGDGVGLCDSFDRLQALSTIVVLRYTQSLSSVTPLSAFRR